MAIVIKWFPPSWLQLKIGKQILYVDPAYLRTNFTNYPKRIEFSKWPDPIDGLPEELEKADIILITHHHKDHCKAVTVNRLKKPNTLIIAPKKCMKEIGKETKSIKSGNHLVVGDVSINVVNAYNLVKEGASKLMHKKGIGVGYLISAEGKKLYHPGDSDFIPEMNSLKDIDVAFLPIGGRGFTMDFNEAMKAAVSISPKMVVPIHRFEADPVKFKEKLEGKSKIRVVPLNTGESCQI